MRLMSIFLNFNLIIMTFNEHIESHSATMNPNSNISSSIDIQFYSTAKTMISMLYDKSFTNIGILLNLIKEVPFSQDQFLSNNKKWILADTINVYLFQNGIIDIIDITSGISERISPNNVVEIQFLNGSKMAISSNGTRSYTNGPSCDIVVNWYPKLKISIPIGNSQYINEFINIGCYQYKGVEKRYFYHDPMLDILDPAKYNLFIHNWDKYLFNCSESIRNGGNITEICKYSCIYNNYLYHSYGSLANNNISRN